MRHYRKLMQGLARKMGLSGKWVCLRKMGLGSNRFVLRVENAPALSPCHPIPPLMKKQHSKNRRPLPVQSSAGLIGIFWWYGGKLLAFTSPIPEGETVAGVVDSRFTHVDAWPALQKQYPHLRAMEYEEVPRGRVLYVQEAKRFRVLMDKVLMEDSIKAAILKKFLLPRQRTDFGCDQHYTTEPTELDRMFDD